MSNGSHTVVLCRIYKVCNGRTIKRTCCACFTRANLQPKMQALEGSTRSRKRKRKKKTNMQSDWPSTKINQSLQRQTRSEGQQVHQVNRIHYYCGGTTALRKWRRRKSTNLKTVKKHRDGHLEYFVFWLRSVGPLFLIFFCNCVIWSSNLFR